MYICRERNSKDNIITKSGRSLDFFYRTFLGRLLLKIVISKPISDLGGLYMNSRFSKIKINRFIDKNNINTFEYDDKKYKSYNDFFTRKVISCKRPIMSNKNALISPCDGKVLAYTINDDLTLKIKDSYYSIDTLVNESIMEEYKGGSALVFRLSTDNYHRYCYIDSGTKGKNYHIKGVFHTVQPISLKNYNFFKTNSREYTILNTNNFDKVIQVEVGALMVGRIKNNHEEYEYKKGEEKGYFEFGGSTIVLLFKKGVITLDNDILENSKENIETIVKYGEKIGKNTFITKVKSTIKFIVK
ncbi:phosphatidylserine decarboxylase [Clostridium sp. CAG:1000]|nr:phosphatidylserine decarboxylase [Clostridium sp. CAG:1000]